MPKTYEHELEGGRRLRACTSISALSLALAEYIGKEVDSLASGIYLLDYSKEELLLFASWSRYQGAIPRNKISTPVDAAKDPVSLCLKEKNVVSCNPPVK